MGSPFPVISAGPLAGLRIVEFAGIGPGPFAGMMLADRGADVVVVDRASEVRAGNRRLLGQRGKRSPALDLKHEAAREVLWRLLERADALIEGFRPGVMERLGLGPDAVAARNPRLVYGRVTGWGQDGPLAQAAGHDLNYVALTGALATSRRAGERPVIPPTLLGAMAGGGMFLVFGIVCAVLEGSDAFFAPVLGSDDAAAHPHNVARGLMVEIDGQRQPAPAPRLSRTPARRPSPGAVIGEHTDAVLAELGLDAAAIAGLRKARACA